MSFPGHKINAILTNQGKRISFYKRAQILVADFWGIMEARGEGNIPNLDYLTMFADYRVPQALVYLGALRYSDALMEALKKGKGGLDCVLTLTEFFFKHRQILT